MAIDAAFSGDRNVINKEAEKFLQYKDRNNSNTVHVECKKNRDLRNNKGNWYLSKSFRKYRAKYWESRKSRNYINSHISRYCTHTGESTNVTTQNI